MTSAERDQMLAALLAHRDAEALRDYLDSQMAAEIMALIAEVRPEMLPQRQGVIRTLFGLRERLFSLADVNEVVAKMNKKKY